MTKPINPVCTKTRDVDLNGRKFTLTCSIRVLDHSDVDIHYDAKEHEWWASDNPTEGDVW